MKTLAKFGNVVAALAERARAWWRARGERDHALGFAEGEPSAEEVRAARRKRAGDLLFAAWVIVLVLAMFAGLAWSFRPLPPNPALNLPTSWPANKK